MTDIYYGQLNAHLIGITMKEVVRRMIEDIRRHLFVFEVTQKPARDGSMTDVVTNIDMQAQQICIKVLSECFPEYGIVAEEKEIRTECTDDRLCDMYFTIDPIDGTKAFIRKQSHGIGTMIALVRKKRIIAAYVGDIMTREIYGYRPQSGNVHRISEYGYSQSLEIDVSKPLQSQHLLIRKRPEQYSPLSHRLIKHGIRAQLFTDYEITGGSIGISTARLWKGEVGAVLLAANAFTPWDMHPIMGISEKLGFSFLIPNKQGERFILHRYDPNKEVVEHAPEVLIIHRSRINEFTSWQAQTLLG